MQDANAEWDDKYIPEVIYEDGDVIVLNKPTGLPIHHDGKTKEHVLTDWLLMTVPNIAGVGEPLVLSDGTKIDRPGIVHRLDRDTSGVLICAKHQEAYIFLKEEFKARTVRKKYNTFLYGVLKDNEGIIDRPIGRSRGDFRKRSAEYGARGTMRDAETAYTVLRHGASHTFVEARPLTGRTHQLRVHFKAIGHPVVCDKLYAPKRDCELGFERLALHARLLSLTLPSGTSIDAEAPLPEDFVRALEAM